MAEQVIGVLGHRADADGSGIDVGRADGLGGTVERIVAGEARPRGRIAADLRGGDGVAVGVVIIFHGAHAGGREYARTGIRARGGDAAQFAIFGFVPIEIEHGIAIGIDGALGSAIDIARGGDEVTFLIGGTDDTIIFVVGKADAEAIGIADLDGIADGVVGRGG